MNILDCATKNVKYFFCTGKKKSRVEYYDVDTGIKEDVNDRKNAFTHFLYGYFGQGIEYLRRHIRNMHKKGILYRHKEELNKRLIVRFKTRFDESYKHQIRGKMISLLQRLYKCHYTSLGHIVATYENVSFKSFVENKSKYTEAYSNFMKKMYEMEIFNRDENIFVRAPEFELEDGNLLHPHQHISMFGTAKLETPVLYIIRATWMQCCQKVGLRGEYLHYGYMEKTDFRYGVKYVMGYVAKPFEDVNLTSAIEFVTNMRSYSMSENVVLNKKNTCSGNYERIAIVNINDIFSFTPITLYSKFRERGIFIEYWVEGEEDIPPNPYQPLKAF